MTKRDALVRDSWYPDLGLVTARINEDSTDGFYLAMQAAHVTETDVKAAVDAMASNGMKAAGYKYVNLYDCWQGERDSEGKMWMVLRVP